MTPSRSSQCRHDETVRKLLATLFPEEMKIWSPDRHIGLATIAKRRICRNSNIVVSARNYCRSIILRQSFSRRIPKPHEIRSAMVDIIFPFARQPDGARPNEMFGTSTIEVRLTATAKTESPSEDSKEALVASELLHALRIFLVNQRPQHHPDQRPSMDYVTCQRQHLPPLVVSISECQWYRTVYWLCDIFSVLCMHFTIEINPCSSLLRRQYVFSDDQRDLPLLLNQRITSADSLDIRIRSYILRWKLSTMRRRFEYRCKICTMIQFRTLCTTVQHVLATTNDSVKFVVSCRFVRMYIQTMIDCCDQVCEYHMSSVNNDYVASLSHFIGVQLRLDELFKNRGGRNFFDIAQYRTNISYFPHRVSLDEHATFIGLTQFAFNVAIKLPWAKSDRIVHLDMTEDIFEYCQFLPMLMLMFWQPAPSQLQMSYNVSSCIFKPIPDLF